MIELTSEGCRISNVERSGFAIGEAVKVQIDDLEFDGRVRWAHDTIVGVRLDRPLYSNELGNLIARGRGESCTDERRYGT